MEPLRPLKIRTERVPVRMNAPTRVEETALHAPSARAAWVRGYETIRAVCSAPNAPGVGIFAADAGGITAAAVMAASPDAVQTATIGRQGDADVQVPHDDALSGRHLVLILHPHPDADKRLVFRLVDLRTPAGLRDERGVRVDHLVCNGPAFVQIGKTRLMVVPLNDPRLTWPDSAAKAWDALPDRVLLGVEAAERGALRISSRQGVIHTEPTMDPQATWIHTVAAPTLVRPVPGAVKRLDLPDDTLGELVFAGKNGATATLRLDRGAVRSGLILGRADRCDAPAAEVDPLEDPRISRVHLMILEVDRKLWAIDTASANGLYVQDARQPGCIALRPELRVTLGKSAVHFKWMPPTSGS